LNRADPTWFVGDEGDRTSLGGTFRICGKNLLAGDPEAVQVRLTGPMSIESKVVKAEKYALTVTLPADAPEGTYKLAVHNGLGGPNGWSAELPFVVERPKPWPRTVFNVVDFGTKGPGATDDTPAVREALAKARQTAAVLSIFPGSAI
jgi:hypothetical protein